MILKEEKRDFIYFIKILLHKNFEGRVKDDEVRTPEVPVFPPCLQKNIEKKHTYGIHTKSYQH